MESSMGKGCGDPILMDGVSESPPSLDPLPAFVPWKTLKSLLSMAQKTSIPFWEKDYHAMSTENKGIFLSSTDTCTTPAGTWTLWQPSEKTPALLLACINKSYDSQVPRGN